MDAAATTTVSQPVARSLEVPALRLHTADALTARPSTLRVARRAVLRLHWYDMGVIGLLLASAAAIIACLLNAA